MNAVIIFGAEYLIYVLALAAVACFFTIEKSLRHQLLVFAVITLPLAYILAKMTSLLYYDTRPFVVDGFVPLIPHAADNGFPSDHTLAAATISAIIFRFERKQGIVLFVMALLVGISRVLAGVHHAVDVFGSVTVSVFACWVVYRWIMPLIEKKYNKM